MLPKAFTAPRGLHAGPARCLLWFPSMALPCSHLLHKQELVACRRQWPVIKGETAGLVQEKQKSQGPTLGASLLP